MLVKTLDSGEMIEDCGNRGVSQAAVSFKFVLVWKINYAKWTPASAGVPANWMGV